MRRIAHVDLDAFFASVEQRDDPALRGRPIAVGGRTRGVVTAASYEARAYGVTSAMPVAQALRLCPGLIRVRPRMDAYREASDAFHDVLASFTDTRDRAGLDEAYLDLSHHPPTAAALGDAIRDAVRDTTGLTCSVGISSSKFVAKVASDVRKPDGLTVVHPRRVHDFLAALPVERFHGVGPATAARLHAAGLYTGADLQRADPQAYADRFGRTIGHVARLARGDDTRPVGLHRQRKSIGAERTLGTPATQAASAPILRSLAERVVARLRQHDLAASTVALKMRSPGFVTTSRQRSLDEPVWTVDDVVDLAADLLHVPAPPFPTFRLLGICLSALRPGAGLVVARQLPLWTPGPSYC